MKLLLTAGAAAGHRDDGSAASAQPSRLRTGACELATARRGPGQAEPSTGARAEQIWQNAVRTGKDRSALGFWVPMRGTTFNS